MIDSDGVPIVIDFTGFTGAGFSPTPAAGQLSSDDWAVTGMSDGDLSFGGTETSGDFARGSSTGGIGTGGIYSFDTGGGNATLGVQPGGSDFTPGTLTLQLINNIGSAISTLDVSYDVFSLNDQPRSNSFNFSYSVDDVTYTPVASLDFASAAASDASGWGSVDRSTTISGLNVSNGTPIYLRWSSDDVSGSGSRDEIALDNVMVTASTAVPEPTSLVMVGLGCVMLGRRRRR